MPTPRSSWPKVSIAPPWACGKKARRCQYYYQALGVAPADKRSDLHRRLGELLLQLQRFAEAEEEACELLDKDQNDATGWRVLALALHGQSRKGAIGTGIHNAKTLALLQKSHDSAPGGEKSRQQAPGSKEEPEKPFVATVGEVFQQAKSRSPGDIEIATTLAAIYRNEPQLLDDSGQALSDAERQAKADQVVDEMVAANPQTARAYLARYRYRLRYNLPARRMIWRPR